jgi:hypothetical protein
MRSYCQLKRFNWSYRPPGAILEALPRPRLIGRAVIFY